MKTRREVLLMLAAAGMLFAFDGCNEKGKLTHDNLKAAIIGETTASVKYAAFAVKAREEGFPQIAVLFEATSKAETMHARNHKVVFDLLGLKMESFKPKFEVKSTAENLQNAIKGEGYEVDTMYPDFMKDARHDRIDPAISTFSMALHAEMTHKKFFITALAALNSKTVAQLPMEYFVCSKCGNTFSSETVGAKCPLCGTHREKFFHFKG